MDNSIYWIWFQQLFEIGSRRAELLMDYFEHPREIYEGVRRKDRTVGMLTAAELSAVDQAFCRAEELERRTRKKGCDIVTPDHPSYPRLLLPIYSKPAALYVKGDLSCLEGRLAIGMVGTRQHTDYGRQAAHHLARGLVKGGAAVISGLAQGLDTECHRAALDAGGYTVGILGCGIDVDYPAGSATLKRAMSGQGAVVTELPLGSPPLPHHFPIRNRIISGMSRGLVVVEADLHSGTLITAKHAMEQGRDLFAVPGGIFSQRSRGANYLIRDGAKLVEQAEDILEEYPSYGYTQANRPAVKAMASEELEPVAEPPVESGSGPRQLPEGISSQGKELYGCFTGGAVSVEEASTRTGLDIPQVQTALTELEIYGLIQWYPGRKFGLN